MACNPILITVSPYSFIMFHLWLYLWAYMSDGHWVNKTKKSKNEDIDFASLSTVCIHIGWRASWVGCTTQRSCYSIHPWWYHPPSQISIFCRKQSKEWGYERQTVTRWAQAGHSERQEALEQMHRTWSALGPDLFFGIIPPYISPSYSFSIYDAESTHIYI